MATTFCLKNCASVFGIISVFVYMKKITYNFFKKIILVSSILKFLLTWPVTPELDLSGVGQLLVGAIYYTI